MTTALPGIMCVEDFLRDVEEGHEEGYFVSSKWLLNLEGKERESLILALNRAGYWEAYKTTTSTFFERIENESGTPMYRAQEYSHYSSAHSHPGEIGREVLSDFDSTDYECGGARIRVWHSQLLRVAWSFFGWVTRKVFWCRSRRSRRYLSLDLMATSRVWHPQLLRVACSFFGLHTATVLSPNGDFTRKKFGDSIVTMPELGQSQNISTTIEKPFTVTTIEFSNDGKGREMPVNLTAFVTTTLKCYRTLDRRCQKVRIEFSKISGEIKDELPDEESCNAMVLSSVYTNVYACCKGAHTACNSEQIVLDLDPEYFPLQRRVSASGQQTQGDSPALSDLEWLEVSGRTPKNCEPGSTTLALLQDVKLRRKEDAGRLSPTTHPLIFQRLFPVIFEGEVNVESHPELFSQFHVRYQLEVRYYKPRTPVSEEGPVWPADDTTKVIDFGDCCLEFRTETDSEFRSRIL